MDFEEIFRGVRAVLVIDWPAREVPDSLSFAGFDVYVKGGPGPEDYSRYEVSDGAIAVRRGLRAPERVELIYAHRPLKELPGIIESAKALHAKVIWLQSGLSASEMKDPKGCWLPDEELRAAQTLVMASGLDFVTRPYIGDVVRGFDGRKRG